MQIENCVYSEDQFAICIFQFSIFNSQFSMVWYPADNRSALRSSGVLLTETLVVNLAYQVSHGPAVDRLRQ
jgi:hypothetical protein